MTGAAGFIGANLTRRLLAGGHETHALVRPGGDPWRLQELSGDVAIVEADLRDPAGIERVVRELRPDWVFHMAAHGAYSWQRDSQSIVQSALLGTIALVDSLADLGCEALVLAGSSSEYGFKDHPPREDEALEPNSAYAVAKAASSMYGALAARTSELPAVTLRLYSVYGPFEDPRRLLPRLVALGLRGELPDLVAPETARDFVYVDDAVEAFMLATGAAPGTVYNVGSGVQTTLEQIVELVRAELGVAAEPQWGSAPARDWDTAVWVSDPGRAREDLGWRAGTSLAEGVRATAGWLRDNPGLWKRYDVTDA